MDSYFVFFSIILLLKFSSAKLTSYNNGKDILNFKASNLSTNSYSYDELGDHTIVTDSNVFPYVVAILKKTTYLSAGALIDDNWVVTAADSLFLLRESVRILRVRLGSINNKKGGVVSAIKYIEFHPFFHDTKPEYDVALIRLATPVRLTPNLNPIRMQQKLREVTATHFIVTSWPASMDTEKDWVQHRVKSMEVIKRHRMLTVSHLHPSDPDVCTGELDALDVNNTETIMCLDQTPGSDSCSRDIGAPVVLNSILWGIVSSWKSEDCDLEPSPSFVTLLAARDISPWIQATLKGNEWVQNATQKVNVEDDEDTFFFE